MSCLLSSPSRSSCVQAAAVLEVSHDEVNRFLLQGNYTGKDLYEKAVVHLEAEGGTLSGDVPFMHSIVNSFCKHKGSSS